MFRFGYHEDGMQLACVPATFAGLLYLFDVAAAGAEDLRAAWR
jgi:hypothetical protein